jgi:hypothetical protein
MYIHVCDHAYVHTHIQMHIYTYKIIKIHMYAQYTHIYIHILITMPMGIQRQARPTSHTTC